MFFIDPSAGPPEGYAHEGSSGLSSASFSSSEADEEYRAPATFCQLRRESVLPDLHLQPYDSETLKLLSSYFERTINSAASAKLAGKLVFPHSEAAAKLFAERVRRGELPSRRENLLSAYSLFPRNPVAAEAMFSRKQAGKEISLEDELELYVARNFPNDEVSAEQVKEDLAERAELLRCEDSSGDFRKRSLISFVREELSSGRKAPMSVKQLSYFFSMSKKEVRELLADETEGLKPHENQLRTEKRLLEENSQEKALQIRIIQAIRNLVAIENDQHRSATIPALSERKQIAALFGIRTQSVRHHVRYVFPEDLAYREKELKGSDARERQSAMLSKIKQDIERGNPNLATDLELAEKYELSPVTVFHALRNGLSDEEHDHRISQLRVKGERALSYNNVLDFASAELEAFGNGQLDRISNDSELASYFGLSSEHSVYNELSPVSMGLSRSDYCKREYILALQSHHEEMDDALNLSQLSVIREKVAWHRSRDKKRAQKPRRPGGAKERMGRGHVRFRENKFDSEEEAVVGVLLQKYLPGFELREGDTLQVELNGRYFDFRYGNLLIEYHPTRMYYRSDGTGSFDTLEEYLSYKAKREELKEVDERQASDYEAAKKRTLRRNYRDSRQQIIDDAGYSDKYFLIVAGNREELWHRVIDELGEGHTSFEAFKAEWNKILKAVRER